MKLLDSVQQAFRLLRGFSENNGLCIELCKYVVKCFDFDHHVLVFRARV